MPALSTLAGNSLHRIFPWLILVSLVAGATIDDQLTWSTHGDTQYHFSSDLLIWQDAKQVCDDANSALLSPTSPQQRDLIEGQYPLNTVIWIGANDQTTEGAFTWEDGSPVDWTDWFDAIAFGDSPINIQPNGGSASNCVELRRSYNVQADHVYWNDVPCSLLHVFGCQRPVPGCGFGASQRGSCPGAQRTSKGCKHRGKRFSPGGGGVVYSTTSRSPLACANTCLADDNCRSANYRADDKLCEILNTSPASLSALTDDTQAVYISTLKC